MVFKFNNNYYYYLKRESFRSAIQGLFIYVCIYTHICVCTYVCTHTYIYIRIYISFAMIAIIPSLSVCLGEFNTPQKKGISPSIPKLFRVAFQVIRHSVQCQIQLCFFHMQSLKSFQPNISPKCLLYLPIVITTLHHTSEDSPILFPFFLHLFRLHNLNDFKVL